jgi:peptide-methionine (S)-S-oxide reductase
MMAGPGDGWLLVSPEDVPDPEFDPAAAGGEQSAVLAGGCFWCVEAVYVEVEGVLAVTSGYAGGTRESADYRTVCGGRTDHAEVVKVTFDPSQISYGQVLKLFFSIAHDPTQLNRQGADIGRQYRSAVFYVDEQQQQIAESYIMQLNASGVLTGPIVTEVVPLEAFYEAEEYHQNYAARNPAQPYIAAVALPKVRKLREHYGQRLKTR